MKGAGILARWFGRGRRAYADLQVHSYYSDGHLPPEDLLRHAGELGLKAVAVTDHDNLAGTRAALAAASSVAVEVIPALELTTWWRTPRAEGEVDLLGYFVDVDDTGLIQTTLAAMSDIVERVTETCQRLTAAGYPLSMDDIRAVNPRYPAKAVSIWALTSALGCTWEDATVLYYEYFNRVRPCALSTEAAIAAIRGAGGVPVLAHPGRIALFGEPVGEKQLGPLVDAGLEGIEVYYPSHRRALAAHFRRLAETFELVQTGGSDEHAYLGEFSVMGSQPVSEAMVEALRARAQQVREAAKT